MHYKSATNEELNRKLAELLNKDILEPMTIAFKQMINQALDDGLSSGGYEGCLLIDGDWVNYCTDWSATMPLAEEYAIGQTKINGLWMTNHFDLSNPAYRVQTHHYHESLLRAIVICLIKALESQQ